MAGLAQPVPEPGQADEEVLVESLLAMVRHEEYPCLGARSVVRRDRMTIRVYDELGSAASGSDLLADLREFAAGVRLDDGFVSFVAMFRGPQVRDEAHFEALLWAQLRAVHAADGAAWAPGVSADPQDAHFAFSAGGQAYFVVGLHPRASRDARRAAVPTLVLNLHEQFEQLREAGGYERMRDRIRERDVQLQGSVNPMVRDHGESSEARQYAGRLVGEDWRAPFRARPVDAGAAPAADADAPGASAPGAGRVLP